MARSLVEAARIPLFITSSGSPIRTGYIIMNNR